MFDSEESRHECVKERCLRHRVSKPGLARRIRRRSPAEYDVKTLESVRLLRELYIEEVHGT